MKRIISLLFVLMALPCLHLTFAQDTTPLTSMNNEEASSIMNQYFGALVNGDVITLKTLLGGDLLKTRRSLLDNPEYPGFLSTTYMNATLKVLNLDTSKPDTVVIDALITFKHDDSIRNQYVLRKSPPQGGGSTYRIVSETSMAEKDR
jgi:hypothetical protein